MKILEKASVWIVVLVIIYSLLQFIPQTSTTLSLIYQKIIDGEYFRFLTYQFVHLNYQHFIENMVGFIFIGVILSQIKIHASDFFGIYLITGIFAALPLWYFVKSTILGASVALYGGYGISSLESKHTNKLILMGIISATLALEPVLALFLQAPTYEMRGHLLQSAFHGTGLIGGILLFSLWKKIKPYVYSDRYTILQKASEEVNRVP